MTGMTESPASTAGVEEMVTEDQHLVSNLRFETLRFP